MHRIRATQVRGGSAVDIDLDEAGVIVRGVLKETDPETKKILISYDCTIVYLRTLGAGGQPLIEYVVEQPDELYAATPLRYGKAVKKADTKQPSPAKARRSKAVKKAANGQAART